MTDLVENLGFFQGNLRLLVPFWGHTLELLKIVIGNTAPRTYFGKSHTFFVLSCSFFHIFYLSYPLLSKASLPSSFMFPFFTVSLIAFKFHFPIPPPVAPFSACCAIVRLWDVSSRWASTRARTSRGRKAIRHVTEKVSLYKNRDHESLSQLHPSR